MKKSYRILSITLVVLITLLVIAEASRPEPLNWFPSYSAKDKIPFGTYIFHQELKNSIDNERITHITIPPFEFMESQPEKGSYFFVNESVYFDESEANRLLSWVEKGNQLFVSAGSISKTLLDTLNLEVSYYNDYEMNKKLAIVNLSNPNLSTSGYKLDKEVSTFYFSKIDTTNTTVLGVYDLVEDDASVIKEPKINFIKVPFGDGKIFLHTFPEAYTNYFMVSGNNAAYTGGLLSYLPKEGNVYLDQYYKSGKTFSTSPLYLIFKNKYLKWAYYTLLIIALFWVYFEGKRKQRSIPIIKPLPNQTVAFTETIASMYMEKKERAQIATHTLNHFMEWLRSTYGIKTQNLGADTQEIIAAKSGKSTTEVKKLIDYIQSIKAQQQLTDEQLINLNRLIEDFKK